MTPHLRLGLCYFGFISRKGLNIFGVIVRSEKEQVLIIEN
jgi:hypothetical protein